MHHVWPMTSPKTRYSLLYSLVVQFSPPHPTHPDNDNDNDSRVRYPLTRLTSLLRAANKVAAV